MHCAYADGDVWIRYTLMYFFPQHEEGIQFQSKMFPHTQDDDYNT